ncbi:MAG TPA: acyl-CoA dehydrogenase family protein [Micromonosporaceae bacterium]
MRRFVQSVPAPGDPYRDDPLLRSWLDRLLADDGHGAAADRLTALSTRVRDELRDAHHDAENHPPVLHRYGPWGERIDRIDTSPGWRRQARAAVEHALVALPYQDQARRRWGAAARVVQHALLHLYGPESATYSCPVAMSDGAAALLSRDDVDPAVRDAWLPRLLSTDPDTAVHSGQWMTEAQGGSDIARSTTTAVPAGDGSWRLTGEKWFCSAADAPIAIALARPAGAPDNSSRVLAPFLVPRYAQDSPLAAPHARPTDPAPGVRIHRLKDKLGTRALPTAEIGLRDAYALPVGDPTTPGLARMMTLVVVTRLHNAAAAAGGMRRGLTYAVDYASCRQIAGGLLLNDPLHRATLAQLAVDTAAAFLLAGHAFALLGRVEVDGDPDAAAELRLVAPVAKIATGRWAVTAASEYVECFGGAGYVEDTGVPRLLRDAQVLPIWEGTSNVLSVDVLRALRHDPKQAHRLLHRLDNACDTLSGLHALPGAVDALAAARADLAATLVDVDADPTAARAAARDLALRLADALTAALLAEHAAWAAPRGDDTATLLAALWSIRRLARRDIAAVAARHSHTLLAR